MVINIGPELEAALKDAANLTGVTPEEVALSALRERFLGRGLPLEPQDDWEWLLHSAASDCGVSLSNEAVSSEGIYE